LQLVTQKFFNPSSR